MDQAGIEVFLAIARTLSISRAAEQLNMAQSTVSKRLNDLEHELGTKLIERSQGAKSIYLTASGEEFSGIALRWQGLWDQAQGIKLESRKLALSFGTLDSLSFALFPPLYRALSQHRPHIRLSLTSSHSAELYDLLERRQIDVGFTLLERTTPNIIVENFFSEPMVVLCAGTSERSESAMVHPRDLDPEHELYLSAGLSYKLWHDQWWDPGNTTCIRLDSAQLVLSFFCSEKQWAILPFSVAMMAKSRGDFKIFHLAGSPPQRIVYKISHKHPKPSTQASLEVLDHYLARCLQPDTRE